MSERGGIIFCATGKSGIGHIRRISNVAHHLAHDAPDIPLELVVNAPPNGLSEDEMGRFSRVHVVARDEMTALVAERDACLVVVDTAIIPGLSLLPVPLFLILRETRMERVQEFRLAHGRQWQCAFIPAPQTAWTISGDVVDARAVENVGWIYRQVEVRTGEGVVGRRGDEAILLVATGGGGALDGAGYASAAVSSLIGRVKERMPRLRVVQALGPRASREMVFDGVDDVIDVDSRLNTAFAEADLVVSTAGYNSVLELAQTTTPTLLMAVPRSFDDQEQRAREWGARIGRYFEPAEVSRLVDWAVETLVGGQRRQAVDLGGCGGRRVAKTLIAAAEGQARNAGGDEFALYTKIYHRPRFGLAKPAAEPQVVAACARQRARVLQAAGIATPLAMSAGRSGDRVVMPRLRGETVRTHLTARVEPSETSDGSILSSWLERTAACLRALHDVDPAMLALSSFDPWAKIEPRLRANSAAARSLARKGCGSEAAALGRLGRLALERAGAGVGARGRLLHGDFHCGQLIATPGDGELVLLDLDDLCVGDREADLANFTAHFATTRELARRPVADALDDVSAVMVGAYASSGGEVIEGPLFAAHQGVALLRRAAKLAEPGADGEYLWEILAASRQRISKAASKTRVASRPGRDEAAGCAQQVPGNGEGRALRARGRTHGGVIV